MKKKLKLDELRVKSLVTATQKTLGGHTCIFTDDIGCNTVYEFTEGAVCITYQVACPTEGCSGNPQHCPFTE